MAYNLILVISQVSSYQLPELLGQDRTVVSELWHDSQCLSSATTNDA
jgi:hypothetical protein